VKLPLQDHTILPDCKSCEPLFYFCTVKGYNTGLHISFPE